MKALADLLAENPDRPKIWVIYNLLIKFISQYRKLGPVFKVLGSHFKKMNLDKLLEDICPLIKDALEKKNQQLAVERKAEATGKSIEDIMNNFNPENIDYKEETSPEDLNTDGERKDFKNMIKNQL